MNGDTVVNLDDLLGISRVVDNGSGSAKLEVYNQNIGPANDPTGATLLGSITLTGIAPSGATEINQLLTQPGQIEIA